MGEPLHVLLWGVFGVVEACIIPTEQGVYFHAFHLGNLNLQKHVIDLGCCIQYLLSWIKL